MVRALSAEFAAPAVAENFDRLFEPNGAFIRPDARLKDEIFGVLCDKARLERAHGHFVADRCPADVFNLWLSRGFAGDSHATSIIFDCCRRLMRDYDAIVLLPWGTIPLRQIDSGTSRRRRTMNRWVQFQSHSSLIGIIRQWGCRRESYCRTAKHSHDHAASGADCDSAAPHGHCLTRPLCDVRQASGQIFNPVPSLNWRIQK